MSGASQTPGEWKVDVKGVGKGEYVATASGVLLVPHNDAFAIITDAGEALGAVSAFLAPNSLAPFLLCVALIASTLLPTLCFKSYLPRMPLPSLIAAGDSLFRVAERVPLPPSSNDNEMSEVVTKAAVRILKWKIWTTNRVLQQVSKPSAPLGQDGSTKGHSVSFTLVSSVSLCKPKFSLSCASAVLLAHSAQHNSRAWPGTWRSSACTAPEVPVTCVCTNFVELLIVID